MDRCYIGMLAKSKAGHDIGLIYVIINEDDTYVYLADGKNRTVEKPKKKKKKHVQLILEKFNVTAIDNVAIKRIIKKYNQK